MQTENERGAMPAQSAMTQTENTTTSAVPAGAGRQDSESSQESSGPERSRPQDETAEQQPTRPARSWLSGLLPGRRRERANPREDLAQALLSDQTGKQAFSDNEKAMLNNILRLQDLRVEDLMVPRADIEAVEIDIALGDLLKLFEDSGHSRMPVYNETLDDPRGMVHIRDVVAYITNTAAMSRNDIAARKNPPASGLDLKKVNLEKPLGGLKLIRKVLFVPPSMQAAELMARMQASRIQMALVIDEYGGTEGLVSLEDIVEVVVGDIEDEHDSADDIEIVDKGDGVFLVDAKAELEDVAEAVGAEFVIAEHSEDVDTIGGLIFALAGRIPVRGEVIEGLGYEFRVIDADPRRVKRVEITPSKRRRPRRAADAPA
jgi:CBS domain containing-hemolysin-like protein